jgi:hypothetical protein
VEAVSAYFTPAGDPYGTVLPLSSAQAGDPISFTEDNAVIAGTSHYYAVKATSAIGQRSASSNRVGIFSVPLVPGSF